MAVGSKGATSLDLDWVTPTELEVTGPMIMPTRTNDLRCKLSVASYGMNLCVSKLKGMKSKTTIALSFVAYRTRSRAGGRHKAVRHFHVRTGTLL